MKPFILIVEDDPQIRRFLRATLAAEGYLFHEVDTAAEGLIQANARRPDLVLLDLGLPDRDGLEVIRRIRESSQLPIVVLSARGEAQPRDLLDRARGPVLARDPGRIRERQRTRRRVQYQVAVEDATRGVLRIDVDFEGSRGGLGRFGA